MGLYFTDQYSLLHFATGIIMYFWKFTALTTLILHTIFEFFENTEYGMYFINHYFKIWPGGKQYPDSITNSLGDTFYTMIGFFLAKYVDYIGKVKKYYFNIYI